MGVDLFEKTWPLYPENGWSIEKLIINLRTGQFMWHKEDKNTEKNKAKPMEAQKNDKQKKAVKSMKKKQRP